jgi:capsular exopolysaccharide synthesis family protein
MQALRRQDNVDYLYKATRREAVGVVDDGTPNDGAEALAAPSASRREAAARSINVVVAPSDVERLFAVPGGDISIERAQAQEECRALRFRVLDHLRSHGQRTLMVTSAVSEEGKTSTAINLAFTLSQVEGVRVLLVDADMRKPIIARLLGIPATRGLVNYLQKPEPIAGFIWQVNPRLAIMPSIDTVENTSELLHSESLQRFVDEAKLAYDVVIFDAPPLCPIADAQVLATHVDGVVFCILAGRTPVDLVSSAVSMVRQKIVGAVLVGAQKADRGYGYAYGHTTESGKKK